MANPSDVNTAPTASLPYRSAVRVPGHQPGDRHGEPVEREGARRLHAARHRHHEHRRAAPRCRSAPTCMITTGFALPGFDMKMRAYPALQARNRLDQADRLQVHQRRHRALGGADADGRVTATTRRPAAGTSSPRCPMARSIAFTDANASTLSPYLNTWDAAGLIDYVRTQPLGAVISSTPAFMDPPSLDPPPDSDYPGFRGRPRGSPHAHLHWRQRRHDARHRCAHGRRGLGVHPVQPAAQAAHAARRPGRSTATPTSSTRRPRWPTSRSAASGARWSTFGEGVGGTFYQAFDASLDDMASSISPDSDSVSSLLSYFNNTDRIKYLWAFPQVLACSTRRSTRRPRRTAICRAARRPTRSRWARPGPIRPSVKSRTPRPVHHHRRVRVPAAIGGERLDTRRRHGRAEAVSAVGRRTGMSSRARASATTALRKQTTTARR